ncbi:MAG: hypothetical protein UF438_04390 [Oribacterium sp.]|nr:hypothetical protein [Oribacterium sp.]
MRKKKLTKTLAVLLTAGMLTQSMSLSVLAGNVETSYEANMSGTESNTGKESTAENTSDVGNSENTDTAAGDAQNSVTSIERPSQSDTVEMLPGTPAQNGLIPKENTDNAGSSESGTSSPEAGTASGTSDSTTGESGTAGTSTGTSDTTGTTAGATDETGASGNTADSTSGSADTTGAADTSTDATGTSNGPTGTATETTDTSTETGTDEDYTLSYDKETKHFNITFNIKDGAEGDQTIELSKVNDAVAAFGKKKVDEWLATEEGQKWLNDYKEWPWDGPASYPVKVDKHLEFKVTYSLDEKYNLQRQIVMVQEPGDITTFDISVSNGSKHTYVYKDGSLTVATAKIPENQKLTEAVGFDGQKLPDVIAGNKVRLTYSHDPKVKGWIEDLMDDTLHLDRQWGFTRDNIRAVNNYIMEHYHNDTDPDDDEALSRAYEAYILEYYNTKDHTSYTSVADLLENNDVALKDLNKSGMGDLCEISFDSPTYYNYFYKNVLNLKAGDPEELRNFKKVAGDKWKSNGNDLSIGDYMYDKLNSTEGAWDKANSYFNTLLSKGLTKDEATWAAFALAVNIDGKLGNNNIQNKPLDWYASMVLKQADGTLKLQKVDEQGNVIGADGKDENQTSFYLWYKDTETDKDGKQQDVTKYCVYTKPQYGTVTKPDGTTEQKLVKDGYYGWVDYDPENKKMDYTISTTNGTLNIDYALLEGMVYYMKEKVAPAGYDVDTKIHVLCDEATYQEMSKKVDGKETTEVVNPATGEKSIVTYMGSIKGGETLEVNFVDKKTSSNPGGGSSGGSSSGGGSHSDPSVTPSIAETTPEGQVLGVSRTPEATSSPAPVTGRASAHPADRRPVTKATCTPMAPSSSEASYSSLHGA